VNFQTFRTFVFAVGILVTSVGLVEPARAATITFAAGGANPTNINIISQLFIVPTNAASVWRNNTGSEIWDMHFITDRAQGTPLTSGGGGSWFSNTSGATNSALNFDVGGAGMPVPRNQVFTITTANFLAPTVIRAHATVPEPSTMTLLGVGFALFGLKIYRGKRAHRV
jgi:hypothetical protein